MEKRAIGKDEFLYGYVNEERVMIKNSLEQIGAFIVKYPFDSVKIVNLLDVLEIETSVGFVFYCRDQEFLALELHPYLISLTPVGVELPKFVPYIPLPDNIIDNVQCKSGAGHYLGSVHPSEGTLFPHVRHSGYYFTLQELKEDFPDSISRSEAFDIATKEGWL